MQLSPGRRTWTVHGVLGMHRSDAQPDGHCRNSRRRGGAGDADRRTAGARLPNGCRKKVASDHRVAFGTCRWTPAVMWPCASDTGSTLSTSACSRRWTQKRAENPHVDLLVGAVNVWCWDRPGTGNVPGNAESRHRADSLEQSQQTGADSAAQRDGRSVEPLRHLPGRDEPGEFPQARLRASRLDQRRLAQRHHPARRRLVGDGLGRGGQGRGVVRVRRAVRPPGRRLCASPSARGTGIPSVSLPLHRHDHGRRMARMLSSRITR